MLALPFDSIILNNNLPLQFFLKPRDQFVTAHKGNRKPRHRLAMHAQHSAMFTRITPGATAAVIHKSQRLAVTNLHAKQMPARHPVVTRAGQEVGHGDERFPTPVSGRRQLLAALGAISLCAQSSMHVSAADAATSSSTQSDTSTSAASKLTGLSPQQLAERIRDDFVRKQYYVTGNLSSELFADDCLFTDPTIKVTGWKFYTDAVKILFDADQSKADLISLAVLDDGDIELKWRLEGIIKPWPGQPSIKPYTGVTRYVQNSDGLIAKHLETWDTSIIDVFLSVFWKGFGAPPAPPVSG